MYLLCLCAQLHLTLCDNTPGFSVHGIFQARILEWVATSFSRGSSWPRDRICVSCVSCIAGRFFTHRETPKDKVQRVSRLMNTQRCQEVGAPGKGLESLHPISHSLPSASLFLAVPEQYPFITNQWGVGWGEGVRIGWRLKRERLHIQLWLIRVVVRQKPTQQCKAIILQFKSKLKNKISQ